MAKKAKNLSEDEEAQLENYLEQYIKPKSPEEIIIEGLKKAVGGLERYYIELPSGYTVNAQELYERYLEGERSEETQYLFKDALEIKQVQDYVDRNADGIISKIKRKKMMQERLHGGKQDAKPESDKSEQ